MPNGFTTITHGVCIGFGMTNHFRVIHPCHIGMIHTLYIGMIHSGHIIHIHGVRRFRFELARHHQRSKRLAGKSQQQQCDEDIFIASFGHGSGTGGRNL